MVFISYLNVDRMNTYLLPVFLPTQSFVLSSKLNLLSLLKLAKTYFLFRCPTKLLRSFLGATLSSSLDTNASRFNSKLSLLFIENRTEKNRVAVVKSIRPTANRKRRVVVLTSVRKRELMTFGEERKETLEKRTRDGQEYATELQLF